MRRGATNVSTQLRGAVGQTSVEWLGVIVVVSALTLALASSGIGGTVTSAIGQQICKVVGGDCGDEPMPGADRGPGRGVDRAPAAGAAPVAVRPAAAPPRPAVREPGRRPRRAPGAQGLGPAARAAATGSRPRGYAAKGAKPKSKSTEPPGPPPRPKTDRGAGEFGSKKGRLRDRVKEFAFRRLADLAEAAGWGDMARHMRHYLDGSGKTLTVDPARMLRDMKYFRSLAAESRQDMFGQIRARARGAQPGTEFEIVRRWELAESSRDSLGHNWFYAMGGFSYTYTAKVRVLASGKAKVDYQLHVFDRYNWDTGKAVEILGVTVSDEQMQELHRRGLAREYDIRGSAKPGSVTIDLTNDDPVKDTSPPSGRRDGGRTDPGRDR